jgi:hypothetical protein
MKLKLEIIKETTNVIEDDSVRLTGDWTHIRSSHAFGFFSATKPVMAGWISQNQLILIQIKKRYSRLSISDTTYWWFKARLFNDIGNQLTSIVDR